MVSSTGMVASQRALASQVGAAILRQGGHAVDAAVATAFALAVVLPRAGNLAGGGFLVLHDANSNTQIALDFRERAPAKAHPKLFQDETGNVDQDRYRYSLLATGVPGTVAGLEHIWQKYGRLSWAELIAPAIDLAETGFVVSYDFASALNSRKARLTKDPYTASLFFKANGDSYQPGERFTQPELAQTLRQIANGGAQAFYEGPFADALVDLMQSRGGLIDHNDLQEYEVVVRAPVRGQYLAHDIVSMPPPSSGGVHLVQMLNVLAHFPLQEYGRGSAASLHVMAETMKLAYADRSRHLGDPDFHRVPVAWLTSADYAKQLANRIDQSRATPSAEIQPGVAPIAESEDTTHLSVMDKDGNAVALTTTLNFSFGNGVAVPGTGVLLNNEMTDFSAKPGAPDGFGLITGLANAVEAGKRPLSAMTPTLVLRDGKAVLATGSPGGSRIINAVLQHIVNILAFDQNVAAANNAPRIHHQWMPDRLQVEAGFSPDTLEKLRVLGHPLTPSATMGSVQAIAYDGRYFYGSADPRRPGALATGGQVQ